MIFLAFYVQTSAWASSLSWWGNRRSNPPVWMSRDSPWMLLAITEHSICQPGRPYNQPTKPINLTTTNYPGFSVSNTRDERKPQLYNLSQKNLISKLIQKLPWKYYSQNYKYIWTTIASKYIHTFSVTKMKSFTCTDTCMLNTWMLKII